MLLSDIGKLKQVLFRHIKKLRKSANQRNTRNIHVKTNINGLHRTCVPCKWWWHASWYTGLSGYTFGTSAHSSSLHIVSKWRPCRQDPLCSIAQCSWVQPKGMNGWWEGRSSPSPPKKNMGFSPFSSCTGQTMIFIDWIISLLSLCLCLSSQGINIVT